MLLTWNLYLRKERGCIARLYEEPGDIFPLCMPVKKFSMFVIKGHTDRWRIAVFQQLCQESRVRDGSTLYYTSKVRNIRSTSGLANWQLSSTEFAFTTQNLPVASPSMLQYIPTARMISQRHWKPDTLPLLGHMMTVLQALQHRNFLLVRESTTSSHQPIIQEQQLPFGCSCTRVFPA